MIALAVAAVLILLLTAVMLAVEEYDRMRERARESLHRERLANASGAREEQRTYWDDQRQRTIERCERELDAAVEDLRVELELYGPDGFLWLDESGTEDRRENQ